MHHKFTPEIIIINYFRILLWQGAKRFRFKHWPTMRGVDIVDQVLTWHWLKNQLILYFSSFTRRMCHRSILFFSLSTDFLNTSLEKQNFRKIQFLFSCLLQQYKIKYFNKQNSHNNSLWTLSKNKNTNIIPDLTLLYSPATEYFVKLSWCVIVCIQDTLSSSTRLAYRLPISLWAECALEQRYLAYNVICYCIQDTL